MGPILCVPGTIQPGVWSCPQMINKSDKEVKVTCKFELHHRFSNPPRGVFHNQKHDSLREWVRFCAFQRLCQRKFENVLQSLMEVMEDSRRRAQSSAIIFVPPPRGCTGRASRKQQALHSHVFPPPRDPDKVATASPCGQMPKTNVNLQKTAAPSRSAAYMRPHSPCSSARKRESKPARFSNSDRRENKTRCSWCIFTG